MTTCSLHGRVWRLFRTGLCSVHASFLVFDVANNMSSVVTEERSKHLADFFRSGLGSTSVYPPGFTVNQKRRLRQQAASFVQRDGVLFYSPVGQEKNLFVESS